MLDKVDQLRQKNPGVLDDLTLEILRAVSSPDIDVRKKAIDIALELLSSKNVDEVVLLLNRELSSTVDSAYDKASDYRSILISAIHHCAVRFSEVAERVVGTLMDFIADFNNTSAVSSTVVVSTLS